MILHELFRLVSRFPRYISCYIVYSLYVNRQYAEETCVAETPLFGMAPAPDVRGHGAKKAAPTPALTPAPAPYTKICNFEL